MTESSLSSFHKKAKTRANVFWGVVPRMTLADATLRLLAVARLNNMHSMAKYIAQILYAHNCIHTYFEIEHRIP